MFTKSSLGFLSGLLALSTFACAEVGSNADASEDVAATANQAIIRGTELSAVDAENSGVVLIAPSGCTGSMLDSRWAISAAHCFNFYADADYNGEIDNPLENGYQLLFGNANDYDRTSRQVDRIIRHPNSVFGSAERVDVVLLHLTADAPLSSLPKNHFTNGRMAIYGGTNDSLLDAPLTLLGYGANAGTNPSGVGYGILRSGHNLVDSTDDNVVIVGSPSGDHLTCNGDSGGPSYLDVAGPEGLRARFLVGIHSRSTCDWINGASTDTGAQAFRDWVVQTAWGTPSTQISCLGQNCQTSPRQIPNNAWAAQSFVPWGADPTQCYFYYVNYAFETNYDFTYVSGNRYTGTGTTRGHWCGALPLSLTTDNSILSYGLTVSASNHTVAYNGQGTPSAGTCDGNPGNWQGCGSNGCSVCVENLSNHPRYFVNHPKCAPDLLCNNHFAACNDNCPVPTWQDM
jgi:hypothetical protein